MNLRDIRSEIRLLTDTTEDKKYPDSHINDFINRGQMILVDEAELLETTATATAASGTKEYDLDSSSIWTPEGGGGAAAISILRMRRVDYDGFKIHRIGYHQIVNPSNSSGTATIPGGYGYYIRDNKVGIFPDPSAVTIKIYYIPKPTTLSSNTSTPDIDSAYHEALVYYGAWKVAERFQRDMISYYKNEWSEWKRKAIQYGNYKFAEPSFTIDYNDF